MYGSVDQLYLAKVGAGPGATHNHIMDAPHLGHTARDVFVLPGQLGICNQDAYKADNAIGSVRTVAYHLVVDRHEYLIAPNGLDIVLQGRAESGIPVYPAVAVLVHRHLAIEAVPYPLGQVRRSVRPPVEVQQAEIPGRQFRLIIERHQLTNGHDAVLVDGKRAQAAKESSDLAGRLTGGQRCHVALVESQQARKRKRKGAARRPDVPLTAGGRSDS